MTAPRVLRAVVARPGQPAAVEDVDFSTLDDVYRIIGTDTVEQVCIVGRTYAYIDENARLTGRQAPNRLVPGVGVVLGPMVVFTSNSGRESGVDPPSFADVIRRQLDDWMVPQ